MSSVAFEGGGMPAPRVVGSGPSSQRPRDRASPPTIACFLKGHSMDLQYRSILLTGAVGGSGAALSLELAASSSRYTLVGRRRGPLDEVASAVRGGGGQSRVVALDRTGLGAPVVAGTGRDALTVVRRGATRTVMITLNREDPATFDRTLLACKGALEEAVAGHSSL